MSEAATSTQEQTPPESRGVEPKQERELSTIDFPYTSLEEAIAVAKAVHKLGGNECRVETLAGELGHETVKSGGFRQKVSAAHIFGLTSSASGLVLLTPLGGRIVDPDQERAARVEAFLTVPLYAAIYEEFKNGALPPPVGLETKMVSLGVSTKQKDKARQVFQRAAKEAGFFAYGTAKLVYPALGKQVKKTESRPVESEEEEEQLEPEKGKKKNGGNEPPPYHPLIVGLLETLPPTGAPKTEWPLQERQDWLETAEGVFKLIYKLPDVDRGSALNMAVTRQKPFNVIE